jgi:hypothetical protein
VNLPCLSRAKSRGAKQKESATYFLPGISICSELKLIPFHMSFSYLASWPNLGLDELQVPEVATFKLYETVTVHKKKGLWKTLFLDFIY